MANDNSNSTFNILLAEDDIDDRFFFENAVKLIPFKINLNMVSDGEQLMEYLAENKENLPDIIFLDISMPRKTGIECLAEIKENEFLNKIPISMLSTSYTKDDAYEKSIKDMLLSMGAIEYIRKPNSIEDLKLILQKTMTSLVKVNKEKKLN